MNNMMDDLNIENDKLKDEILNKSKEIEKLKVKIFDRDDAIDTLKKQIIGLEKKNELLIAMIEGVVRNG